jgi:hypothetical protein
MMAVAKINQDPHEGARIGAAFQFTRAQRERLSVMVCRLFDLWELDTVTQALLLGLSEGTRATVARYRKGQPMSDQRDVLERVGNLLGIHKSLQLLYPHNPEMRNSWVKARNRLLDNRTPLEVMVEHGLPGIVTVRSFTDWMRGQ